MARLHEWVGGRKLFNCPGCEWPHRLDSRWTWNGSIERPTFTPSLLVLSGTAGEEARCHSFITDGRIQFLADSTHRLAGQTVDMPEWSEEQ